METVFYKILYRGEKVVYVGVTLRTIGKRFKEHLKSKGLNPSNYFIVEFDRIKHPEINSLETFYKEHKKVAELEQKYIKEELNKGSKLLNISEGGEWGNQILNKLKKEEFLREFGSYEGYQEYKKKKDIIKRWIRDWVRVRNLNETNKWVKNWIKCKTENKVKVWLKSWLVTKNRNKTKEWVKNWVISRNRHRVYVWLRNWTYSKSITKVKRWTQNWVCNKSKNKTKRWVGSWIGNKNKRKLKSWIQNWLCNKSKNKTKRWVQSWKSYRSTYKCKT